MMAVTSSGLVACAARNAIPKAGPGKAGRYLREVDVHAVYKDGANLTPVVIHLGAIRDHEVSIAED